MNWLKHTDVCHPLLIRKTNWLLGLPFPLLVRPLLLQTLINRMTRIFAIVTSIVETSGICSGGLEAIVLEETRTRKVTSERLIV
jgi:hypothetical protein